MNTATRFITFCAQRFPLLKRIPFLPIFVDELMRLIMFFFSPGTYFQMVQLARELRSWPEVEVSYHRFGGLEFSINGHEIGHLHGSGLFDLKVSKKQKEVALRLPDVYPHHVLHHSTMVSIQLHSKSDLIDLLELIQKTYEDIVTRGPLIANSYI